MATKLLRAGLFSALVILSFSCKKSSSSSSHYVTFTKNGKSYTFTNAESEVGADLGDPTKQDFTVDAVSNDRTEELSFSIQITASSFPATTYTSDNYPTVYMVFNDDITSASGLQDFEIGEGIDPTTQPNSSYTVNVTSITSSEIKGTFTGNVLYDEIDNDNPEQLTQGSFDVARVP